VSVQLVEELLAVCCSWQAHASEYMAHAQRAHTRVDVVMLTAMASTLNWAARDLVGVIDSRRRHETSSDN
jgi:hypothetical protein